MRGAHIPLQTDRFDDDIAQAAADGCGLVRFDLPWACVEPTQGRLDGGVIEDARLAAQLICSAGMQPWARLLQPVVPRWFDNEGGFTDDRATATHWPRWIERCADALGDVVHGWVPIEAPYALARRLVPDDLRRNGELTERLVVAWRDAWRILRGGGPLVATSIDVATVRPRDPTDQRSVDLATREDELRWGVWLYGLARGVVDVPGRALRELADLQGACDVLGIAATNEVEGALHRAAEMGPPAPLALTYRAPSGSDAQRRELADRALADARRVAGELPVSFVTVLA